MSEHALDREMRLLIDANHRLTEVLVGMANVVSDTRRLHEELDLETQLTALIRMQQGGPLNGHAHIQQAPGVTGNGAYATTGSAVGYHPQASIPTPAGSYTLKEALANASRNGVVEQTPYPDETTYPGVPGPYRKTYGYGA